MKQIILALTIFFSASTYAQNDCSNGRYLNPVFPEVSVTPGIPYGSGEITFDTLNTDGNAQQPLLLDVYQPILDLETEARPVIVWAFGGAFVYGARVSPDIVELSQRYAALGYVCVSIDYRLSDELLVNPSPENATKAALKGVHDMRAALRYLYMTAKDLDNLFRIDTNQIYVGGVSAGAFNALHIAYLDKIEEVPEILMPEFERTGGFEGNSGNPGYSSKVAGVINLCGALGKKEWLEVTNVPIVSMHGTEDDVVPYDEDTVRILDINYPVAGSAAIHRRANEVFVKNDFYTFYGAGHVPFVGDTAYMDTTFEFTRDFMYNLVCPDGVSTSISEKSKNQVVAYPNPSIDEIRFKGNMSLSKIRITDLKGRTIYYQENHHFNTKIKTTHWEKGVYLIHWESVDGTSGVEKLFKED